MQILKRKYRDNISLYDFKDKMLNRTNAMFTWDGLPDTIPAWILELYLQTYGNVKLVGLPSHMTDTITDLMSDDDAVSEINAGHCGLKPTSYVSKKYNRQCYGADFYNIE